MTQNEKLLWEKIEKFEIDEPGADFKFSARLARENGWTHTYAKRVIQEYKKFIFLCCISPAGVTPSDPVDQAWHLHLTFTRSYWINLCQDTLNQQIHHNPTKGGQQEAEKFNGYYTSSQTLYQDKFGIQPPADIWQDNHTRFTEINFQRVNMNRHWLIKKPRLSAYSAVLVMLFIACAFCIQATEAIAIPALIGIVLLVTYSVYKKESAPNRKNRNDDGSGSGCGTSGDSNWSDGHHGGHHGDGHGGDSGCGSGCSGCGSGCGGCGGD
jgi:hypothetical protein